MNATIATRTSRMPLRCHRLLALTAAATVVSTACGGSDSTTDETVEITDTVASSVPAPASASAAITLPPTSLAGPVRAATTATTPAPVVVTTATALGVGDDELAARLEAVLADAIAPGSIRWDASGIDAPATAAVAAVRIPGREDVLVAVGENVDGSPVEADAPFFVGNFTENLVRSVAFQMVDEGVLDPTLTVDLWAPTLPNADRVTVQMVIDSETGWSDDGPIDPDPVSTDFGRVWSLREKVEMLSTVMTALAEPGTRTNDGFVGETVLGLIVEEVSGRPLVELVRERVSEPADLDDTTLTDGRTTPAGYRHGVLVFGGAATDTSAFTLVSFATWWQATHSVVSTPSDLLDLLDAWATGDLFTTDRTPAPDRFAPDPAGSTDLYVGLGTPFNGYCPCIDVDGGVVPTAIGRVPGSFGTRSVVLRYADGISVVVNVNSNEAAITDIRAVATTVYEIAVAAR